MTQTNQKNQNYNLVPYKIDNNRTIDVTQIQDDVWLNQKQMAQLFNIQKPAICKHIKNIYKQGELDKNSTCNPISILETGSNRNALGQFSTENYYNLDMIISVGYRVNSKRGVLFRQWATQIIKDRIKQEYENRNSNKNTTTPQISTEKKERAKLIKDMLFKREITQKQIGKEIGLSYVSVCKAINGHTYSRLVENWLKEHLGLGEKENDFNEKSKYIFEEALQGDYTAFLKVKKILKAVAAVHDFT